MTIKRFECLITKYIIEFDVNEKVATLENVISDYENIKALFVLFRGAVDTLSDLKVTTIQQMVPTNEWNEFLSDKTKWQLLNTDEKLGLTIIHCPIEDFLTNYAKGLGII